MRFAWMVALASIPLAGCEQHALSHANVAIDSPSVASNSEGQPAATASTNDAPAAGSPVPVPAPEPSAAAVPVPPEAAPAKPGAAADITFDDLKFEIEKDGAFDRKMLTPKIEAYVGKQIKIRGYILPASCFRQTGNTSFVLVRDNMECCFGPGAALYDCIVVEMEPGKTADFSTRPVTAEGTFAIQEFRDFESAVRGIYHLDGKSAK